MITVDKETGYPSVDKTHQKGQKYFERHPIIPAINIYHAVLFMSRRYKNDTAVDCLELKITFGELIRDINILSKGFQRIGVTKGDIICVSMPNIYQALLVFFAANKIGATTTYLNYYSSDDEIKNYLCVFKSPIFINYAKSAEYNREIVKGTKVRYVITLPEEELNIRPFTLIKYSNQMVESQIPYNAIARIHKKKTKFKKKNIEKDSALILFTSGTTGKPKSVVLTNKNILAAAIYQKNTSHITKKANGEKCFVCVPFSYPYGFCVSALMSVLCGREMILAPNISINNVAYFLSKKPNIIFGSPALLELIMQGVDDRQDLSSITTFISGGDYLTSSLEKRGRVFFFEHGSSVNICNGSGNAETVSSGTLSYNILSRKGTVGRVLTGSDVIVVDPESKLERKYGEEGLLCVSGKHVFKEYYREPKLTREVKFKYKGKRYYITGTLGRLDKDGYFTLTGREARFYINSSLNKVYCDYVQNAMSSIDVIESVAVVKKPDKENLYTGQAFIVLKREIEKSKETVNYIIKQCHEPLLADGNTIQLKPYEIPGTIVFVDLLPRTKADKIDYRKLEETAQSPVQDIII